MVRPRKFKESTPGGSPGPGMPALAGAGCGTRLRCSTARVACRRKPSDSCWAQRSHVVGSPAPSYHSKQLQCACDSGVLDSLAWNVQQPAWLPAESVACGKGRRSQHNLSHNKQRAVATPALGSLVGLHTKETSPQRSRQLSAPTRQGGGQANNAQKRQRLHRLQGTAVVYAFVKFSQVHMWNPAWRPGLIVCCSLLDFF